MIYTEAQICLKIQGDVMGCRVEVKIVLRSITQEHFQSFYNQESLAMFAHEKIRFPDAFGPSRPPINSQQGIL